MSHLLLLIRVSRVELKKDIISLVFVSKSQDSGKQQKDWERNKIRLDCIREQTDTEEVRKLVIPQ